MSRAVWLSFGCGVDSMALAVLLSEGRVPGVAEFGAVFSDTLTEKPETYAYLRDVAGPFFESVGAPLVVVKPKEGVLERWERLGVTGSRLVRSCSDEGKIQPVRRFLRSLGVPTVSLVGINADEAHRATPRASVRYPLVELDLGRDECRDIIAAAGLPVPVKSGCWCCPFMRVQEVIQLVQRDPCGVARIGRLEARATELHGHQPSGEPRRQWEYPIAEYERRASQGDFFVVERDRQLPCPCTEAA